MFLDTPASTTVNANPADEQPALLAAHLARRHFCFLPGAATRALLLGLAADALADWPAFEASWGNLLLDTYMADGGRYRKRRFATLSAAPGETLRVEPQQPHFQTLDYNPLNGGVARHYEPVLPEILLGRSMQSVLQLGLGVFSRLVPGRRWHIEVHQFRIEAAPEGGGKPTPEGVHRDGVNFVLVMMVRRSNIAEGTTAIYNTRREHLDAFTLAEPLDLVLLNDELVWHGVTPVFPIDPSVPATRDVLVITFRLKG